MVSELEAPPFRQHVNENNPRATSAEWQEEKIVEFHRFVIAATQRCDYPLSRVLYE